MQAFKTNKEAPTSRKIRGGYYTPRALADYLCRWAIRNRSDRIIEPSCGDGSFVSAAVPLLGKKGLITAIEIAPREIEKAKEAVNGAHAYAKASRSRLLDLTGLDRGSFSPALDEYIRQGEAEGVSDGYKCRIRNRWFDVPSVAVPDAFLFRQIHNAPLLVANHAGATSTDTIHRVRVRGDVDCDRLCASMVNSLTFAWAEVCGRSYGGGVLELEPREAEGLFVPYRFAGDLDVDYVDDRLRAGDLQNALDHGDDVLLRRGCGLSMTDVKRAREAWDRLRQRRQHRRYRNRTRLAA